MDQKPYQFQFSHAAEGEFSHLPHAIQKRIWNKLIFFEKSENPLHFAKKLTGPENIFRLRIGDYRVIITPKERNIMIILLILKIGHRREVYE